MIKMNKKIINPETSKTSHQEGTTNPTQDNSNNINSNTTPISLDTDERKIINPETFKTSHQQDTTNPTQENSNNINSITTPISHDTNERKIINPGTTNGIDGRKEIKKSNLIDSQSSLSTDELSLLDEIIGSLIPSKRTNPTTIQVKTFETPTTETNTSTKVSENSQTQEKINNPTPNQDKPETIHTPTTETSPTPIETIKLTPEKRTKSSRLVPQIIPKAPLRPSLGNVTIQSNTKTIESENNGDKTSQDPKTPNDNIVTTITQTEKKEENTTPSKLEENNISKQEEKKNLYLK